MTKKVSYISYNKKVERFYKKITRKKFDLYIFPLELVIRDRFKLFRASKFISKHIKNSYKEYSAINNNKTIIEVDCDKLIEMYLFNHTNISEINKLYENLSRIYGSDFYYCFYYRLLFYLKSEIESNLIYTRDIISGYNAKNTKNLSLAKIYGILAKNKNATKLIINGNINIKKSTASFYSELLNSKEYIDKIMAII